MDPFKMLLPRCRIYGVAEQVVRRGKVIEPARLQLELYITPSPDDTTHSLEWSRIVQDPKLSPAEHDNEVWTPTGTTRLGLVADLLGIDPGQLLGHDPARWDGHLRFELALEQTP